jgi:hypothetical protein
MRNAARNFGVFLLAVTGIATGQNSQKKQTLVVNGHHGEAIVYQIDGRAFVELDALVRIANGSMSIRGDQIVVSLPAADPSQAAPPVSAAASMTPDFRRAAIDHLADVKEWINVLVYALKNGVPGDGSRLVVLHDRATESLRHAQVAATSDAGQSAFQLLQNNFNMLSHWSDKLIRERRSLDTGKYSISPDAVNNDPTYQKISNCTRFLANMIPSGQFTDDNSCH